ncbi:MAG: IS66 family insertion sequence element accessory protein TnpB [Verrucomicrobiae bacterium]|nr:IS66 family insertion sequence element accessory protein TnpB [Verrucomicrobiae bacterium]
MSERTVAVEDQILKQDRVGRVVVSKERREALLDEYEQSGMSGVEFAGWAGVKYPTFAGWLQRRRRQGSRQPPRQAAEVKWLEAQMPPSGLAQEAEADRGGVLVAHLPGGVRVEGGGRAMAQLLVWMGVVRC